MLVWHTETRYYALAVRRDLFGGIEVVSWWGGRGSRRGGMKVVPAQDWRHALRLARSIAKRRHQHGYQRGSVR